jgi:acetolactate synthase I/II/III large subunit
MTASEYLIHRLEKYGVKHVFMIVGGAAMYLNDAVIGNKKIKYICNHHEQAATMAAESYARITNSIGVVLVTSAAASTNTLTGLLGAWWDSIPVVIISGNAKTEMLTYDTPQLRQLGVQDTRIVDIVKPITKYAVCVKDATRIRYEFEKALYIATSGRKGPVWLDIPLDIQGTQVEVDKLTGYIPPKIRKPDLTAQVTQTISKIKQAKHPVIVVGSGVRLSGNLKIFNQVINKLKIPVLTSLTAQDMMYETHPLYGGRFGPYGTQKGNDLIKQADVMLILSERLYLWQIGYEYRDFGVNAYKIMVDIDEAELSKKTLSIELPVLADVGDFLTLLNQKI